MNRFRKAWLALAGKLEPEFVDNIIEREVVVLGSPEPCTLYATRGTHVVTDGYQVRWVGRKYYTTCEQAHAENPKERIESVSLWRIGGMYLTALKVAEVEVEPKPKRAKGRRG